MQVKDRDTIFGTHTLLDQGHTLAAAQRIQDLEDDLAAEPALTARLHERLGERDGQGG